MSYLKLAVATLTALALWGAFVLSTTLYGWWYTPMVTDADPRAFFAAARDVIDAENGGNVALVLIEEGEVTGEHFAAVSQTIDRETVFPTASMSKWITALGVLRLVEDGLIDLDSPVSTYLTRWQLPPSEFDHDGVTVRRLLSHTAGLTDGLGFGDYGADEALPTLEESLARPRASSGREVRIALGRPPGSEWDYSGGGYLILQLVVEEVSGQTFEGFMGSALFRPLGMTRSTYGYVGALDNRSNSYAGDGQQAPLYQYASSAATGFATSVLDLTGLVQAVLSGNALSANILALMREPHGSVFGIDAWGLGAILYAPTDSDDFVFGHDGQNDPAINSAVRINPDSGDALIVLASGNGSLATKLGFEWVFWQTGIPDLLGIGYVVDDGVRAFTYGSLVIMVLIGLIVWRIRRRPVVPGTTG